MLPLLYIGIGVVLIVVILPFLDGLMQMYNSLIQLVNTAIAVKIHKLSSQVEQEEEIATNVIGFQTDDELCCDDDDDDDENDEPEDRRIGFR